MRKPARRKFIFTVRHVFATKHTKRKHLLWCDVWFEVRMEMFPNRFSERVRVPILHAVVYGDGFHGRYVCVVYKTASFLYFAER